MILVERDPEPPELREERRSKVPELARIARTRRPTSKEITGYAVAGTHLWRSQRYKCCYCEARIPKGYNDVEHYRPKTSADRRPGCTDDHGYWWLAFTWSNLLFACPACNRSEKNDLFPLAPGSVALVPRENPRGREQPLLIDPAEESAVPHIEFVFSEVMAGTPLPKDAPIGWGKRKHWWPRARSGSKRGDATIRVCGLDSTEHIELYDLHVNNEVRCVADELATALKDKDDRGVVNAFGRALRLLQPAMPYVGLSYDALCSRVPNAELIPRNMQWPEPAAVGRASKPVPLRRARRQ